MCEHLFPIPSVTLDIVSFPFYLSDGWKMVSSSFSFISLVTGEINFHLIVGCLYFLCEMSVCILCLFVCCLSLSYWFVGVLCIFGMLIFCQIDLPSQTFLLLPAVCLLERICLVFRSLSSVHGAARGSRCSKNLFRRKKKMLWALGENVKACSQCLSSS